MATGYSMSALVDKVETFQSLPEPDFHLPLKDNLIITRGKGSPVQIDVSAAQDGSVMVPVPELFQADFSRASKKTCIQNGQLVEVGIDEPAFEDEGILIEGSSTNIMPYSTITPQWGNSGNGTLSEIAPDGTMTGCHYTRTQTGSQYLSSVISDQSVQGKQYTISAYFKKPEGQIASQIMLRVQTNYPTRIDININLEEQTATIIASSHTNTSVKVTSVNNGWFRVEGNYTSSSDHGGHTIIVSPSLDVSGEVGDSMIVWGIQFEQLPFASSYIPTEGTAVTRAEDRLSMSSDLTPIPGIPAPITISFIADSFSDIGGTVFRQGTSTNLVGIGVQKNSSSAGSAYGKYASGSYPKISNNSLFLFNMNAALTYNNGQLIHTQTSGELRNAHALLSIGSYIDTGNRMSSPLYGHIKDLKIWNQALTPNQIAVIGAKK